MVEYDFVLVGVCILGVLAILLILNLISSGKLITVGANKFKVKWKFRSLDCNNWHFNFIGTGGEEYTGYFDKIIRNGTDKINFIGVYEITISRVIKKENVHKEVIIIDTIIAYVEEK